MWKDRLDEVVLAKWESCVGVDRLHRVWRDKAGGIGAETGVQ